MAVHLEALGHEHLEFVRCLRNHYCKWFFNSRKIGPWEQEEWYFSYLKSKCLFWVIYYADRPVGTISQTTVNDNVYEIGNLMLLPSYQGKGIMLDAMRQVMMSGHFYIAQVKPNNAASLRLFKAAGFWRVPKKRRKAVKKR